LENSLIKNRIEAGKILAEHLSKLEGDMIVLAIPRGGVIVGNEIANKLKCPLDIVISKKITPPDNPEYAIGAATIDGIIYKGPNWHLYSSDSALKEEISKKQSEVKRRLEEYRGNSDYQLENKTVILVDDGIATGSTVFPILSWLKQKKVKHIFLAVPVLPKSTYHNLEKLVTRIFSINIPEEFSAVGQFYEEFRQVEDLEVKKILRIKERE
jgi:putative phosphoribosyl transferase